MFSDPIRFVLTGLSMSLCLQATAATTTTYRCEGGHANGKSVSYSDHPCTGAVASTEHLVKVDPANPTEADHEAALRRAQQDKAELKRIEAAQDKERKQSVAQQQKVQRQKQAQSKQCAKLQLKVKHLKEDVAGASARELVKKRTQLRRAEESLAQECK